MISAETRWCKAVHDHFQAVENDNHAEILATLLRLMEFHNYVQVMSDEISTALSRMAETNAEQSHAWQSMPPASAKIHLSADLADPLNPATIHDPH